MLFMCYLNLSDSNPDQWMGMESEFRRFKWYILFEVVAKQY